jgi:protein SCO1
MSAMSLSRVLAAALVSGLALEVPAAPPAALPPAVEVTLRDAPLVDQDGRTVRLARDLIGDRIVVVDFVFTTCTTICPILSARLARLQDLLGERLGSEVALISISIDPARDTPARLKAYGARFQARTGWSWVTGAKQEVDQVLRGLGAYTASFTGHAPVMLVGDGRTGRWARFNGFPDPARLLAAVDALAAARPATTASRN